MSWEILFHILSWYLLITIGGVIFWLSFSNFLNKLTDHGYALSKIIALSIPAFFLWTLGFIFKFPITNITCILTWILFWGLCIGFKFWNKIKFPSVPLKTILISELSFIIVLIIGLGITSIHPAIDNVTERLMDFNLLNVNTLNTTLPAVDTWFYPDNVNYYYFGHFFYSLFNKITGTDVYLGYELAMGFTYGLAGTVLFSLGYSIKKSYLVAIMAVAFPIFFSNFSFIWELTYKFFNTLSDNGDDRLKFYLFWIDISIFFALIFSLNFIKKKQSRNFLLICLPILLVHFWITGLGNVGIALYNFLTDPQKATLWYPDVSRVVTNMINEFPFYSIVIGDLHPHFLDMVFLPALLCLLFLDFKLLSPKNILTLLRELKHEKINFKNCLKVLFINKKFQTIFFIKSITLIVFSIGIVTNSWELICFGILVSVKDLIFIFRTINLTIDGNQFYITKFLYTVGVIICLDLYAFGGGLASQLPYLRSVVSPLKGIKINLKNNAVPFTDYFKNHFSLFPFNFTDTINKINLLLTAKSIEFGLDTIIIIALFLLIVYKLIKLFNNKVIKKNTFIISIIGLGILTIFTGSFTAPIISYVQDNFDLSPLYQYFQVWIVYYSFAAIGLFFLIKSIIKGKIKEKEYFIFTLFITGVTLSIFTEFFYVAEFFDRTVYEHHRPNTVFKVNYIGFVFLGVASAWCLYKLFKTKNWQGKVKKEIDYVISAGVSLIRAVISITTFLIFLYVPYAVWQWIQFFGFNPALSKISFFIPPLYLIIIVGISILFIKKDIFKKYKLNTFSKRLVQKIAFNIIILCSVFFLVQSYLIFFVSNKENGIQFSNNGFSKMLAFTPDMKFQSNSDASLRFDAKQATKDKLTKDGHPYIIEAGDYLKSIKTASDVLLEANGDGYKFTSIGPVFSSMPTVLGWWGHEAQWREVSDLTVLQKWNPATHPDIQQYINNPTGVYPDDLYLNQRVTDIAAMYNQTSGWQKLMLDYNISYIWVGETEREKFTTSITTHFDNMPCFSLNKEFGISTDNTNIRIYKLNKDCLNQTGLGL